MNGKPAKRSSLFLLELIIAILFFSLASAVCVRFFVKSHTLSVDTKNLNMAVSQASGLAELFLAKDDFLSYMEETGGEAQMSGDTILFRSYFDADWNPCEKKQAAFFTQTTLRTEGAFQHGTFAVQRIEEPDNPEEIYTVSLKKYIGRTENRQEASE